jgi:hypothetical protein
LSRTKKPPSLAAERAVNKGEAGYFLGIKKKG